MLAQLDPVRGATLGELASATCSPWTHVRDAVLANRSRGGVFEVAGQVVLGGTRAPAKLYRLRHDERATGRRPVWSETAPGATVSRRSNADRVATVMAVVGDHGVTVGQLAAILGVGDRSIRRLLDDGGYPVRRVRDGGKFVSRYYRPGAGSETSPGRGPTGPLPAEKEG